MDQNIINLLIALIPSVVGIVGIVSSVLVCISKIKAFKKDSEDNNKELKARLLQSVAQNVELQKTNDILQQKLNFVIETGSQRLEKAEDDIKSIIAQNKALCEQNEQLKSIKAEDDKIKKQLTALIKKGN